MLACYLKRFIVTPARVSGEDEVEGKVEGEGEGEGEGELPAQATAQLSSWTQFFQNKLKKF